MTTHHEAIQLPLYPEDEAQDRSAISRAVPFVKWAGGKRKLVDYVISAAPVSFDRYLEPFVGGGAVALALGHHKMLLNDANTELINAYHVIRDNLDVLLPLLDEHQRRHSKEYFYTVRAQEPGNLNSVEQAARFIYLNRFCFNGLFRTNRLGQFNVPYGGHKVGHLPTLEDLRQYSRILRGRRAEAFVR